MILKIRGLFLKLKTTFFLLLLFFLLLFITFLIGFFCLFVFFLNTDYVVKTLNFETLKDHMSLKCF